jgi:hypothetical protein
LLRSTSPLASGSRGRHWMTLMPSEPRKTANSSANTGLPPRQFPSAGSLSQTSALGTAPSSLSRDQWHAIRSGACRLGSIRAISHRE